MKSPLRIASIVLKAALIVALLSGLRLIWNSGRGAEFPARVFGSSLLVIFVTGICIAACSALARIQRNSDGSPKSPGDQ